MKIFILLMVVLFNQALIPLLNAELSNISSDEARENIRCVCKTQQEIAGLFDVHQTTVSRFLSGKNSPKLVENFNKYLNNSGMDLVLIRVPKSEWLKTLLYTPVLIPREEAVAAADERSLYPVLTPRRKAVAVADERSLQYVKDMYPHFIFIGWHGTSRHDLTLIHDNGIIIPEADKYNPRQGPWLQYGPGFYVADNETVATAFAQRRVSDNAAHGMSQQDQSAPVIIPVFWISAESPQRYDAGEDLELTQLKRLAKRPTANGAISRAIKGNIGNVLPPDIVHGYIKDYETSTQHMFTLKALGKIQLGIAHPTSNIPQATHSYRLSRP